MSTLSSILSSIGGPTQQTAKPPNASQPRPASQPPASLVNGKVQTANNAAAGIKRKVDSTASQPAYKTAKVEGTGGTNTPGAQPSASRFQLSGKSAVPQSNGGLAKPSVVSATRQVNPKGVAPRQIPTSATSQAPPGGSNQIPQKRGYASVLEKAKAAQMAAQSAGAATIKHRPAEKLTKRQRRQREEEARAQQRANKVAARNGTSSSAQALQKKPQDTSVKGNIPRAPAPLSYKGTARASNPAEKKTRGQPQDKYGGYASWSDLDEAEDDEEEQYDSDASSDMEGGFNDVEEEEMLALRAARKEDQAMLEEEERHKREKLERKRKLEALSKNAASAKKRF
ncbi:hypothetical protein BDY17DRAFT_325858 [Neohortaea acidophila]|uniref:SPT2 chromatin protein-domain-containing protein n=1 Tax=Neohortaea acidophila TaxID=245834 RepID=A0A6A6PMC4_9PEZI|nr:uncharacterized protein BDY17DRAFT_325858 [Neohortaea acidophila]KAF2481142.1 hypothetical protein BDY17DRAFT_325858 [Neohortaea acidophila]